eukprot:comp22337_c0_seq1/m.53714 comp22337_c0_seq1/g.53714  ORF comp22337_c0_seq1/g.53714 comp22337_c0_seq1/m.53714 type:complete len:420 (+) comp22337_c0_seq1:1683-2942(+)
MLLHSKLAEKIVILRHHPHLVPNGAQMLGHIESTYRNRPARRLNRTMERRHQRGFASTIRTQKPKTSVCFETHRHRFDSMEVPWICDPEILHQNHILGLITSPKNGFLLRNHILVLRKIKRHGSRDLRRNPRLQSFLHIRGTVVLAAALGCNPSPNARLRRADFFEQHGQPKTNKAFQKQRDAFLGPVRSVERHICPAKHKCKLREDICTCRQGFCCNHDQDHPSSCADQDIHICKKHSASSPRKDRRKQRRRANHGMQPENDHQTCRNRARNKNCALILEIAIQRRNAHESTNQQNQENDPDAHHQIEQIVAQPVLFHVQTHDPHQLVRFVLALSNNRLDKRREKKDRGKSEQQRRYPRCGKGIRINLVGCLLVPIASISIGINQRRIICGPLHTHRNRGRGVPCDIAKNHCAQDIDE